MKKLLVSACLVCSALHLLWPRDASSHTPVTTHLRFNQEIAPLLNAKCAQCHIADGMAMALQTWAEARPWAVAIKEEILSHRMPPWPAQRGYGAFANDIGLTPLEQEFVTTWVDGGVPAGEGDPPLPFDHAEHWMLGEPDRTVTGRAITNPIAAAPDGMVRAVIDPKLDRDTVIRGFDLKPGNKMVHAAFLSVVESGQYLGGWTPWSSSTQVPDGVAFKVPARSRIAVDMLYGSAAAPPSNSEIRLGLYFPNNPGVRAIADIVLRPSVTTAQGGVRAEQRLPRPRTLLAVHVDMGRGGRSVELRAKRPDGSFEPLVWIRNFRQDWQAPYVFRQPVSLPAGSVIQAIAHFDPSAVTPQYAITINTYEPSPAAGARVAHASGVPLLWPRLVHTILR